jgi:hypothetical protein
MLGTVAVADPGVVKAHLPGPAPVSIHDHGDMPGNGAVGELGLESMGINPVGQVAQRLNHVLDPTIRQKGGAIRGAAQLRRNGEDRG